jgi:hypothetical protein
LPPPDPRLRSGRDCGRALFVVAVADLSGGAVVATVDPRDITRLAVHANNVLTADIGEP